MEDVKETNWSSDFAALRRLNEELTLCNEFAKATRVKKTANSLELWIASIQACYREVDPKLTHTERQEFSKLWALFKSDRLQPLFIFKKTQLGRIKLLNKKGFNQRINLCHKLELKLRRLATMHGMLITDKRTFGDVMNDEL